MSILSDFVEKTSFMSGFKNKLINGNFNVTQKGKTFSNLGSFNTVDMWRSWVVSGTHNCTIQKEVLPNGRTTNSMKLVGDDIYALTQTIEYGFSLLHNKTFTISFWAKADTQQSVTMFNVYDLNKAQNVIGGIGGQLLTTTWQKFTRTIQPQDFSASLDSENFVLYPLYGLGTVSGTNTFYITDIQLEEGSIATNFEERPLAIENNLCYRYFYSNLLISDNEANVLGKAIHIERVGDGPMFPVNMRVNPTVNIYSADYETLGKVTLYNSYEDIGSGFTARTITQAGFTYIGSGSGLTIGNYYVYKYTADAKY